MKLYKLSDRKKLYVKICIYEKRRIKLREKYNINIGGWLKNAPVEYCKELSGINKKLHLWRIGIRNIDRKSDKLHDLERKIFRFTGRSMSRRATKKSKVDFLSSLIFCKYALENGITQPLVSEYLRIHRNTVAAKRKQLTKLITTNPEYRDIWNRWKIFEYGDKNIINLNKC